MTNTALDPHSGKQHLAEKTYKIEVQAGWKDGMKVKFDQSNDGFPSMTFVLKQKPHSYLLRRGNDLFWICTITEQQAIRGAKLKVPLPDGEILDVSVIEDTPIKHGHIITIRGKVMPIKGGPGRRNLIIEFNLKNAEMKQ